MLQIGDENTQFIIDVRTIDIQKLYSILTNPSILLVGHNLKFEYKHLLHAYGIKINNLYDTMLAEQILFNGVEFNKARIKQPDSKFKDYDGFSLEDLIFRYLKKTVNKNTRLEFLNIKESQFTLRQINYGAEDILLPLLIRNLQLKGIEEKTLQRTLDLEFKYLPVLGNMELNGMHFNKDRWKEAYDFNFPIYQIAKEELSFFVISNYNTSKFVDKQLNLFSNDFKCTINWTSPQQVIEFFKYLGICTEEISKSTGKLTYTVNAKVVSASMLGVFKNADNITKTFMNKYLKFKEAEQSVTTFGIKFFKYINPITNRVHSNYKQIVKTGRSSSSNPNLQNIPAADMFRRAFNCPAGWRINNADYGAQETLCLAEKSREPNIIKLINEGGDMHCFVAKHINTELMNLTDKEIKKDHSEKRQTAKLAGFAIQFGGTGFTISKNLSITKEAGEYVFDSYFKAFPKLKEYFEKVKKETYKQGYILIDPITGRKQWFKKPKNKKETGAIDRKSLNSPIQGMAGNITKLAGVLFTEWVDCKNYNNVVKLTNIVHDEINVEVKEKYAKESAIALSYYMEKAGAVWVKIVKLKADCSTVEYWSH